MAAIKYKIDQGGRLHEPFETFADPFSQVRLGREVGEVEAVMHEAVDQGTDDTGPIQNFTTIAADVGHQAVEHDNLSIEQHDGDFGPPLLVQARAARTPSFRPF
jgi:hypothetical protein